MLLRSSILLASLAVTASALEFAFKNPFVKQDFSCSIEGASGQEACDASMDSSSSQCVWCSFQSFGVCVSETQAEAIKQAIPGIECDDDDGPSDDDAVPADDDDVVPDDYWKCLKDYSDHDSCTEGGCEWCANKAGYGVCLSAEAADKVDKYDWFDCTSTVMGFEIGDLQLDAIHDPYDPSCVAATLEGTEAACEATQDTDGNPCEWCNVAGTNLCLNGDQAEAIGQFGGVCASSETKLDDPYDTACLLATLSEDEKTCESTVDSDGNGCEWCTVSDTDLCLNVEQAMVAQQIGGMCSNYVDEEEQDTASVNDPYDTACLLATLSGDKATCEATVDSDGQPCEWCSVSGTDLCMNIEQAEIAEQMGGECSKSAEETEEADLVVNDPYDTACLLATMSGDEATCESTMDSDGNACEWCSVSGNNFCLNMEQAEVVQQIGGECSTSTLAGEVEDPYDTACLEATVDQASCDSATDSDGTKCEYCNIAGVDVCMTQQQAQAARAIGGSCDTAVKDAYDPACLQASLEGDQGKCEEALDAEGSTCEWCKVASVNLCLNSEQAEAAELMGGSCSTAM